MSATERGDRGRVSKAERRRRAEGLAELVRAMKKRSMVPRNQMARKPGYYEVTIRDIENNFERFEAFEFEKLVARLFERKGYRTRVTQERGDFGVDVIAEAGNSRIAVQVKHWQASVGGPDVQKTVGSMVTVGCNMAMVVTTSGFTAQAYEIQRRGSPVELWDGQRLRDEFVRHMLGDG